LAQLDAMSRVAKSFRIYLLKLRNGLNTTNEFRTAQLPHLASN